MTDIYPADFGWTPDWADPDVRLDRWFHNMDSVINAGVANASNQLDYDDEVGYRAVRKLRDHARSDDDRPWFTTVSFTHPHDPYLAGQEFLGPLRGRYIPLPAVAATDLIDDDPHSQRLRHLLAADTSTVTDERIIRAYFATVSYVDWIAKLLETLGRHDLGANTVIPGQGHRFHHSGGHG